MAELNYKYGTFRDIDVLKHAKDILEFYNTVFKENPQETIKGVMGDFVNPFWFLVFWGNRLIGMCTIGTENLKEKRGVLYNVGVTKFQRRKNLAAAMNHKLRQILSGWTLRGFVKHDNFPAIFAFGKLGGVQQKKCKLEGYIEYVSKFSLSPRV